jgi:hypothetical protein
LSPERKLKIPASEQIRAWIGAMLKEMRFVISYKKKPPSNDPEHQILISVFYVERDEKPSMEEVLKIVKKHSGDDFIQDSIEVKEGYV